MGRELTQLISPKSRFPHRRGGGPARAFRVRIPLRFPHRRGGGPQPQTPFSSSIAFSPQAWGWTAVIMQMATGAGVFPTGVGVDRTTSTAPRQSNSFSPQAWGWTDVDYEFETADCVFPTGVGVDRVWPKFKLGSNVFPTGVGVDRSERVSRFATQTFSPQAWGWTGLRRILGFMPMRFPHRRGGGPLWIAAADNTSSFSPQAWGWTAAMGQWRQ